MSQFFEYLKMAVSNIKANKVRSFLTMLGIIIGIGSVILIMSLGNGIQGVISGELEGIASGQIALYTYDSTGTYYITNDDIDAIVEEVDGIMAVNVYQGFEGSTVTRKGEFSVNGSGQMASYQYFSNTGLLKGRYFNEKEYLAGTPVCLIGEADAIRLFGSTDVIGMTIDMTPNWGNSVSFTIVGVEKEPENSMFGGGYDNTPVSLYFPMTVLTQIYGWEMDDYYQIYLMAEKDADTASITTQVVSLLERRQYQHGSHCGDYGNFSGCGHLLNRRGDWCYEYHAGVRNRAHQGNRYPKGAGGKDRVNYDAVFVGICHYHHDWRAYWNPFWNRGCKPGGQNNFHGEPGDGIYSFGGYYHRACNHHVFLGNWVVLWDLSRQEGG